jgi:hypothetical protein
MLALIHLLLLEHSPYLLPVGFQINEIPSFFLFFPSTGRCALTAITKVSAIRGICQIFTLCAVLRPCTRGSIVQEYFKTRGEAHCYVQFVKFASLDFTKFQFKHTTSARI